MVIEGAFQVTGSRVRDAGIKDDMLRLMHGAGAVLGLRLPRPGCECYLP